MKTYYKVLHRDKEGNLLSIGKLVALPPSLILTYKAGGEENTAPVGTKLFIFDNYHHAMLFMSFFPPDKCIELWEVTAEEVIPLQRVMTTFLNRKWKLQKWTGVELDIMVENGKNRIQLQLTKEEAQKLGNTLLAPGSRIPTGG